MEFSSISLPVLLLLPDNVPNNGKTCTTTTSSWLSWQRKVNRTTVLCSAVLCCTVLCYLTMDVGTWLRYLLVAPNKKQCALICLHLHALCITLAPIQRNNNRAHIGLLFSSPSIHEEKKKILKNRFVFFMTISINVCFGFLRYFAKS
uniref:Uncharacterized protein n=1 Tax=Glossina austeni TaxID=7395 RepID=A0A1A9UM88_GLOAU